MARRERVTESRSHLDGREGRKEGIREVEVAIMRPAFILSQGGILEKTVGNHLTEAAKWRKQIKSCKEVNGNRDRGTGHSA